MSASRTFPQLHLLTPVFARDAAGERQLVRLSHYLNPPDGFDMAAAPQRAGSLVVPSPRALGGGERSGSGAARHLNVDRELSGVVVELPVGYTPVPLFSESGAHFLRPTSRTCSTGELSGAATGQEVLLARAVAVETAEEAAVDARRSFLKRASEGTRRPSLALPLVSEVIL